ncbi:BZ3500_MvSof-1268-A1-R1_Chr3-2g06251 [Microbotryum saponariae]|uniref:BZ3500_MvSof-1268-A1-R1_Chr3-2g06251 protein n=1 Tax=Microbotryum saponariae TaxID=289078 RepID=A0A2X0NA07_9BASI|nr:BZ3500_MvSof-1268-A1-R1_Chr3-2g06251 [Microbotryum saponariae]SDA04202.1 BZ3501_MvSof-1269-A2-R1_Chr3-2g05942 [Microbotryum saponariae]
MPTLSTVGVAVHTAPAGLRGFVQFLLHHRKLRKDGSPRAQLSYEEGLNIVKKFLLYASTHPLGELQKFTAHHVPVPRFVSRKVVTISDGCISRATHLLVKALSIDPKTIEQVGGVKWWTMRGRPLTAEWIEMRKYKIARGDQSPERILFYIHGGAHFFSSLETHRYQIQRHARKLNGVAFAPSFRLAPQYPFPCALLDVLAAYLELLQTPGVDPSMVVFAGDSSGAGLTLVLLTLLRDLELPMPCGATLISPWVDLAHSFPSIIESDAGDYIPSDGFHYKPSLAWPPLKTPEDFYVLEGEEKQILLDEQMQMYCPNAMLRHPMVSPVNQGSLGGLPPLHIIAGSAELLRDEIIYIAHKAAAPQRYPPSQAVLDAYPSQRKHLETDYPPTLVQLQVFDGAAHVTTTLSITEPAKYMYRACANFGLWAIARANKGSTRSHNTSHASSVIELAEVVDNISLGSEDESSDSDAESVLGEGEVATGSVRIGGHIGHFHHHLIRQRVAVNGRVRPLEPEADLPALQMSPEAVGNLHPEPVRKWLDKRAQFDKKYAKDLAKYRRIRTEDRQIAESSGFLMGEFTGERPPLTSLAGFHDVKLARETARSVDEIGDVNLALAAWNSVSVAPDEEVADGTNGGSPGGSGSEKGTEGQ